jgi:hypothetical protein
VDEEEVFHGRIPSQYHALRRLLDYFKDCGVDHPMVKWRLSLPSFIIFLTNLINFNVIGVNSSGREALVEERVKDATKILNLLRSMSDYKPHFEIIGADKKSDNSTR